MAAHREYAVIEANLMRGELGINATVQITTEQGFSAVLLRPKSSPGGGGCLSGNRKAEVPPSGL
jgi:hypothetical protein